MEGRQQDEEGDKERDGESQRTKERGERAKEKEIHP